MVEEEPLIEGLSTLEEALESFFQICFVANMEYPKVNFFFSYGFELTQILQPCLGSGSIYGSIFWTIWIQTHVRNMGLDQNPGSEINKKSCTILKDPGHINTETI